jgi:hypothetical protein
MRWRDFGIAAAFFCLGSCVNQPRGSLPELPLYVCPGSGTSFGLDDSFPAKAPLPGVPTVERLSWAQWPMGSSSEVLPHHGLEKLQDTDCSTREYLCVALTDKGGRLSELVVPKDLGTLNARGRVIMSGDARWNGASEVEVVTYTLSGLGERSSWLLFDRKRGVVAFQGVEVGRLSKAETCLLNTARGLLASSR